MSQIQIKRAALTFSDSDSVSLPQVAPKQLEKSLTQRFFTTARDSVTKILTSAQAVDGRDAFVKVTVTFHLT